MNENEVIEESAEVVDEAEEITEEEIEDTAEESDEDFDFEYDDEGNIIVPEDEYDEGEEDNSSEEEEAAEEETSTEQDVETPEGETAEDTSSTVEDGPPSPTGKAEDPKDKEIERLKRELEDYKSDTKAAIKKLGGTSDNPLDDLERMAAETEGNSLEKYRADRASEKRIADAQALIRNQQAETIFAADLAELHANYPETRKYKHVREMPVKILHDFAKARNAGFTAKKAYAAAIADENGNTGATAVEKQAQHDSKAHLKSSVPKSSKDTGVKMTRSELAEYREMFPNLSDKEINDLYKKANK